MRYDPAWDAIGDADRPLPRSTIDEVTAILFAPDPPPSVLAEVEVCVVLGSRDCGYKAERAAQLFGAIEGMLFVACGANLSSSGQPEAELIRDILLASGVDERRVLIDEHSTNTAGNLFHADRLIADRAADPGTLRIAILSSGFHRRHVLASLPASLAHSVYVSATGPRAGRLTWHTNPLGRAVILHELRRPGLTSGGARVVS